MYTYWLSLIDIYIHNLLANCCWYVERNWQAFIVAILWFFIWNTFDAIIKHLKLNSKMHGGHFSLCIWNVHTWAMEERWMPIYHFLPFWKLFHTLCVVLTWFVHTDWWAVTRVLCVCVRVQHVHSLCALGTICVSTCVWLCVCLGVYVSGQAGFVFPAVWRESLIPCDLVFLQLLSDQNNRLSLPGDPQDGPKPCLPCFFWISFLGLLLLVPVVIQRISPFREKSRNIGADLIKLKFVVMG